MKITNTIALETKHLDAILPDKRDCVKLSIECNRSRLSTIDNVGIYNYNASMHYLGSFICSLI